MTYAVASVVVTLGGTSHFYPPTENKLLLTAVNKHPIDSKVIHSVSDWIGKSCRDT